MQITKVIATEVNTATTAGTATSISDATCVRLFNTTGGDVTIGINTIVGAATTSFFTMPTKSVEFLQKFSSDVIWTSSAIKANKVAFTN
jgi:hypothetical protein